MTLLATEMDISHEEALGRTHQGLKRLHHLAVFSSLSQGAKLALELTDSRQSSPSHQNGEEKFPFNGLGKGSNLAWLIWKH